MILGRRGFIGIAAGFVLSSTARSGAEANGHFRPEDFGAKGDGVTNDTDALAAMAAAVSSAGGGTIAFRKATYLIGKQTPAAGQKGWAFTPSPVLELTGLSSPLSIEGNGAVLRCAPELRYGTFNRETGEPTVHVGRNLNASELATPYTAMVRISRCSAPILIQDLELDGNIEALKIGGTYGDTGFQIPAIGLFLADNMESETVRRVHTHHHGQDGMEISGADKRLVRSLFEDVRSEYNARQGLSMIGGRGYDFVRCRFNHTGRVKIHSAPGAGVDIEAEGHKTNRDFTFTECEFINNIGCGLVADSGDSADMKFSRCAFVGTTIWSAWPYKPEFIFYDCSFVGAVVHPFSSPIASEATKFVNCRFSDDPNLSPTGQVYQSGDNGGPLVNMAQSDNVLFVNCNFDAKHGALLPWSWRATYQDCTMVQTSVRTSNPKGLYRGNSTISGKVDIFNTKVEGSLTINGRAIKQGLHGGTVW